MAPPPDRTRRQLICWRLVRDALRDPRSVVALPADELDLTLRLLRRARLLGRLGTALAEANLIGSLPGTAVDQLESAAVTAEARARAARWELDRVAWALSDLPTVPIVVLKGCAYLLAGTPNSIGRGFNDVDLLVPEEALPEVEEQLKKRGWQAKELSPYDEKYYRVWAHEIPPLVHGEREMEVDLHHGILMRTARLRPSSAMLLESSRPVPGSRFKILAPSDMVLHAMVHLFYGGEMDDAIRELVDIADMLRYFDDREAGFLDGFWKRAEALDLTRPAVYGSRYASKLLCAPVPRVGPTGSRGESSMSALLRLMDWLVQATLVPLDPDGPSHSRRLARVALVARSHWVRMSPLRLAGHLTQKLGRRAGLPLTKNKRI